MKTLPAINLKKATRTQLKKYVNANVSFYQFVDLSRHTDEQLRRIIEKENK